MRVLVLASDCNPEWPSLPIVGYKAARALAEVADVTVATHVRNRENLDEHGFGKAEVVYLDNEYIARPIHRLAIALRAGAGANWTTAVALRFPSYLAFEWEAYKRFGPELQSGHFDVVHRLTPMSPTLPSPMATWSPVPFVLGPLNGALPWPKEFQSELRREREYLRYLRRAHKFMPYYGSTTRDSAAILASFRHTIEDLPPQVSDRVIDFPEVGVDPELFARAPSPSRASRLTFAFVGRFVPLKLLDVALRVFAASEELRRHRLVLIGDGMERARLEAMATDLGLRDTVEFKGWMGQADVGAQLREADIFFFPSIRELGAGVVVEAMAAGCVPVVVDYGGPGGLVTAECGVKVPVGDKDALVSRFVDALEGYAANPDRRIRHARAAHQRALRHYTWEAKARKTLEVYDWVLGRRDDKPVFGTTPIEAEGPLRASSRRAGATLER